MVAPPTAGFLELGGDLIPANPIAAASNGALLPLVVFTLAFAVALTRLPAETRGSVVAFFRGVADAMLEIVRWILWIAPLGVFGLAYALGARTGLGSTHAVAALLILVAAVCLVYMCAVRSRRSGRPSAARRICARNRIRAGRRIQLQVVTRIAACDDRSGP